MNTLKEQRALAEESVVILRGTPSSLAETLIGRTFKRVLYDGANLYLEAGDGRGCLEMVPNGDCCAHCYVQHVVNIDALWDARITYVTDIECTATPAEIAAADVLNAWGHRIGEQQRAAAVHLAAIIDKAHAHAEAWKRFDEETSR